MPGEIAHQLLGTLQAARTKIRAISLLALLAASAGALLAAVLPSRYTATASFFPESRSPSDLVSGLGGLAGLVGAVGAPLGFGQPSSQFFADLVKSHSFQDGLGGSLVVVDSSQQALTVANYLVPRETLPAIRRWKARKLIRRAISVATLPSGVVVITVTDKSPFAAAAIANRAVQIIDDFNVDFRRRQAAARRRFTEQFLQDVEQRLKGAEDRLEGFLTSNRSFVTPALLREQQSLQVEVERLRTLQQQVEISVENARLGEYNNAPVVVTVDVASVPERPSGPLRWVIAVGVPLGALFAIFWLLHLRLWQ